MREVTEADVGSLRLCLESLLTVALREGKVTVPCVKLEEFEQAIKRQPMEQRSKSTWDVIRAITVVRTLELEAEGSTSMRRAKHG